MFQEYSNDTRARGPRFDRMNVYEQKRAEARWGEMMEELEKLLEEKKARQAREEKEEKDG